MYSFCVKRGPCLFIKVLGPLSCPDEIHLPHKGYYFLLKVQIVCSCDLFSYIYLKITPQPGDYYIFPPEILHGFEEYKEEKWDTLGGILTQLILY